MKKIIKGKEVLFDKEYEELINSRKWCFTNGYLSSRINYKIVCFHNIVLPFKKGFVPDHINRNKLDNRKCNLRYVNNIINALNNDNDCAFYHKNRNKPWSAKIQTQGKQIYFGYHKNKEDAIRASKKGREEIINNLFKVLKEE